MSSNIYRPQVLIAEILEDGEKSPSILEEIEKLDLPSLCDLIFSNYEKRSEEEKNMILEGYAKNPEMLNSVKMLQDVNNLGTGMDRECRRISTRWFPPYTPNRRKRRPVFFNEFNGFYNAHAFLRHGNLNPYMLHGFLNTVLTHGLSSIIMETEIYGFLSRELNFVHMMMTTTKADDIVFSEEFMAGKGYFKVSRELARWLPKEAAELVSQRIDESITKFLVYYTLDVIRRYCYSEFRYGMLYMFGKESFEKAVEHVTGGVRSTAGLGIEGPMNVKSEVLASGTQSDRLEKLVELNENPVTEQTGVGSSEIDGNNNEMDIVDSDVDSERSEKAIEEEKEEDVLENTENDVEKEQIQEELLSIPLPSEEKESSERAEKGKEEEEAQITEIGQEKSEIFVRVETQWKNRKITIKISGRDAEQPEIVETPEENRSTVGERVDDREMNPISGGNASEGLKRISGKEGIQNQTVVESMGQKMGDDLKSSELDLRLSEIPCKESELIRIAKESMFISREVKNVWIPILEQNQQMYRENTILKEFIKSKFEML